ncbi:MAG: arylsulfatase [Chloroflexota bacterium]
MNKSQQPNVIFILADDLGFSDIGCFGSEINTPNLDALGKNGLLLTQMYNSARCCPSRASLLTGLTPHQAGVGHMVDNLGTHNYQGYLSDNCVTIAECLKSTGYQTFMSGKWHVGGHEDIQKPEKWRPGEKGFPTPKQRGFDKFFGTLTGAGNFYNPPTLMLEDKFLKVESNEFHYTDEISKHAVKMIDEKDKSNPFFMYVAFTAPHWPLHAWEEDISKYEGKYRKGWSELRMNRYEEMRGNVIDPKWKLTEEDPANPSWNDVRHKDWEDLRMATYAAQIEQMDRGIGTIVDKLKKIGELDNTVIIFAADNGGCAEFLAEDSNEPQPNQFNNPGADGKEVKFGNIPDLRPGPADTFMSYDLPWANVSNTPFRLFKRWVHEGGISTPFVVHWPEKITKHTIIHTPVQFADISPTIIDICGAKYPKTFNGNDITPVEGESFARIFDGSEFTKDKPLCWEHEGNKAIRIGRWKLVSEYPGPWELYNVDEDRSEVNDLINKEKDVASKLKKEYKEWTIRCGILDWPVKIPDQDRRKIIPTGSKKRTSIGLEAVLTPLNLDGERRFKRKPPNEDKNNVTVRGMRFSRE